MAACVATRAARTLLRRDEKTHSLSYLVLQLGLAGNLGRGRSSRLLTSLAIVRSNRHIPYGFVASLVMRSVVSAGPRSTRISNVLPAS